MSASCLVDGEGIVRRSHKHETEKLRNQKDTRTCASIG